MSVEDMQYIQTLASTSDSRRGVYGGLHWLSESSSSGELDSGLREWFGV
jgi:hypothetical protein